MARPCAALTTPSNAAWSTPSPTLRPTHARPGAKALKGQRGLLRNRVGHCRVVSELRDREPVVHVFNVGHRSKIDDLL